MLRLLDLALRYFWKQRLYYQLVKFIGTQYYRYGHTIYVAEVSGGQYTQCTQCTNSMGTSTQSMFFFQISAVYCADCTQNICIRKKVTLLLVLITSAPGTWIVILTYRELVALGLSERNVYERLSISKGASIKGFLFGQYSTTVNYFNTFIDLF